MVSSRIRFVQSLTGIVRVVVLATTTLTAAACVLPSARSTLQVPEAAIIDLTTERVAARLADGSVQVLIETSEGVSVITSSIARRGETTVNLLSYGGETGGEWNTFVYGTTTPGVDHVELDWPGAVGGDVVDGSWLIALSEKDVTPDQLRWTLLGADGTKVASGTGLVSLSH